MILKNKKYPNYHVKKHGKTELRIFRDGKSKPLKPDYSCTQQIIYTLSVNCFPLRVCLIEFIQGADRKSL